MAEMSSRERMLCALEGGRPDRVPATVHQWQKYHLDRYMGGMSDVEAFRAVGLDAAVLFRGFTLEPGPDWIEEQVTEDVPGGNTIIRTRITTPAGTLSMVQETNDWTTWITEPPVKQPEDIECLRYRPVPRIDRAALAARREEVGEDGIVRVCVQPGVQAGCWQDACEFYGTQRLILAALDTPDWVQEFLTILSRKKLEFIETQLAGTAGIIDLVESGGGAACTTVISPALHERFCLPFARQQHELIHQVGLRAVYHTCGGMMPILDLIVANGCDANETLSPAEVGGDADPAEIKRRIGDKVALIGGLNQIQVLTDGTPEQIRAHVHDLFEAYGPGGGYIMSPSDHFFYTAPENVKAYADAARECTY